LTNALNNRLRRDSKKTATVKPAKRVSPFSAAKYIETSG
jgi:hypothetical protein